MATFNSPFPASNADGSGQGSGRPAKPSTFPDRDLDETIARRRKAQALE